MRSRLDELSKELIREKVKVQRLETATTTQPNQSITSFVNTPPANTDSRARSTSDTHRARSSSDTNKTRSSSDTKSSRHDAPAGEKPAKPPHYPGQEPVHRRRTGSRSRKHHDREGGDSTLDRRSRQEPCGEPDKRLSNRSSSGSDCYYNQREYRSSRSSMDKTLTKQSVGDVAPPVPLRSNPDLSHLADLPPIPMKLSSLSRKRGSYVGLPPNAPPAPPAPPIPAGPPPVLSPVKPVIPPPAPPPAPPLPPKAGRQS